MTRPLHSAGRRQRLRAVALCLSAGFSLQLFLPHAPGTTVYAQTVYLPSGHPAYGTIERLRGAGLVQDAWLNRRPISRKAVAAALLEGLDGARERDMTILARETEWRMQEFSHELAAAGVTGITPGKRPLSFYWEEEDVNLTAEITAYIGYDGRKDIPDDFKRAAFGGGGIELYGNVGKEVGYAARHRQTTELRYNTARIWEYSPDLGLTRLGHTGGYASYSETFGHFSWDGRFFGADFVFDSPAWGPSPERNLVLSGNSPSFGHVQGRVAFGNWMRYAVLL